MPSQNHTTSIQFLPIPGFPFYRVGSNGTIWSCFNRAGRGGRKPGDHWRELRQTTDRRGYKQVYLCATSGEKSKTRKIHHLVLEAFVGPRPPDKEACHYDGNPANNNLSNLRWDTHKANHADQARHGRTRNGSSIHQARLTEADIPIIRRLAAEGMFQKDIGKKFGVAQMTVSQIVTRKNWKHVP